MHPPLADLRAKSKANHKYIEDRAGDGALIGLARDDDGNVLGVEIFVVMAVHEEDEEDGDEQSFTFTNLYLDPNTARDMAMYLTMNSIFAEDETGASS